LGLFLQIVVFLIVAAALGFAVGWLLRGTRLEEESAASNDWQTRLSGAESERDRLRGELAAATEDRAAIERARRAAEERAAAGDPELKARATRLERELEEVRAGGAGQRAEIERLQARLVELQTRPADRPTAAAPLAAISAAPQAAGRPGSEETAGSAPAGLPGPEGEPDDLKRISGIGPGIEKTLHELGVFHFRQIAAFTPDNVAWVNRRLRFKGRIEREDWIGQARTLAAGGEPELSQRPQPRPS
jgi:NADH-quinone oxidoreductase subunit E